jgi:mono/diheme cytochrome c family protein
MCTKSLSLILLAWATLAPGAFCGDAAALWAGKVQPLFDVHCVKCHGPIEQKSGLELDTPEAALKGGDEGVVIVAGKPEESRLYQYLARESDPHMPPKKQLSEAEMRVVRDWIQALGAENEAGRKSMPAHEFASISEAIDFYIAEGWSSRGEKAAPALDDRTWCRRIYLDLAGRIPTVREVDEFMAAPNRELLVDRLLATEDYAVHMRELWDVFLMGRPKRKEHEDRRKNKGWWDFLEGSFRENRAWNQTVRELLLARPEKAQDKGAYWFLYERRDEHQVIAEAVAPIVYGTRINCAQCHDHPLAREIRQAHYWGLVAAFNRSKNVRDEGVAESAIGGYVNFTNLKKESQPAVVTLLNGKTVPETWPDGDKKEEDADDKYLDPKAKVRVPKFSRREAFADAATHENPLLARAFVNRMWAVLLGRGLVHPADEMNARNVPSHPELLDWLAKDFALHGYDIKRFVRGVVLSRVYGLGHGGALPESFAGAIERPLTAEQLARSWAVAAGTSKSDDDLRRAAVAAIPDVLPKEYNATFQQAQFLENSPVLAAMVKQATASERLSRIQSDPERVREVFLMVLGRPANEDEIGVAVDFVKQRAADPAGGMRDLLWALMTSAEFLTMP